MCFPPVVTLSFPFSCSKSSLAFSSSFKSALYFSKVASSGSTINSAFAPSIIPVFPFHSSLIFTPIIAGIFIVLAKIAVWEFEEPSSVTKPRSFSLSSCTVSLGARSFATTITDSSKFPISISPLKIRMTRSLISFTSTLRALKYSSSISANIFEKLSPVTATA